MDLQSPSVLAQLPRPLHASTGKTRISDVFSLADAKKRKRYEVAVAVDGEAVNIYNVQTPKLVTSYAVPPQSTFSCRPCSVRRKLSKKSAVRRQTYTAVTKPEHQIKCFVEEIGSSGSSAPVISSSTTTVTDSTSPTTFVGIVPSSANDETETDPFDILAVHQDGRVRRLSSDLKTQRWSIQHSEIAKVCSTHNVQSSFLVEFEDAKKALFKRRQDLASMALGDLTASGVNEPSILLVVSQPKNTDRVSLKDIIVQMFSVPADSKSQSHESQRLRHLQTFHIPDLSGLETANCSAMQWSFHSGSAGLNLSFEKGFINVDLSQYSPSVTSQFVLDEHFSSVMRISPQFVIGASKSLVAVYDTQYNSVQRSIPADDISSSTGSTGEAPTNFISYFAKLGIAVATKGNTLIAFDLSSLPSAPSSSLKRTRDSLLIDAIGKGIGSSAAQWDVVSKKHRSDNMASLRLTSPEQVEKWTRLTQTLEKAAKTKNIDLFDNAVLTYFSTSDASTKLPVRGQYVNPEATLFLLSKIFAVEESTSKDAVSASSSSQLRVAMWPPTTCEWLIQLGHLSFDNVEIALRRACKPQVLQKFPTGSFIQALLDSDPSLKQVNQVLEGPILISSDELAYALKVFLNQARSHSGALEETARAISNGDVATPTQELTKHLGSETANLKDIFTGLNTSLQKIHAQPLPVVVTSLRSNLSRTELFSMVHHLRLSLATGGYTSRFTENPPHPHYASPDYARSFPQCHRRPSHCFRGRHSVTAAASREMELIADMKSEVSAALAGVEEATYLKGIMCEYLRFADQVVTPAATSEDALAKMEAEAAGPSHLVRYEKLNGADLMIFTRPGEGEDGFDGDAGGKMLPLSLKATSGDVSRTKMKKSTGEIKSRTSREIGYLRRKAVGKYSFERLII
ncbi:hypothetical protein N7444_000822 [Penicillium canescens]|nr:hypothetical protein N7444_000822 [Penicillium canescens]